MSKAEKKAWEWSVKNKLDPYSMGRAYGEGYKQAEKDLALTWEDIREICTLSVLVEFDLGRNITDERHYTEVLNRFNKQKGK